jgi:DNA-binding NarL/FixJ family response regulator
VLWALADGLSDKEIAKRLNVSVGTVGNHFTNIFKKLGVHSRLQVLVFALRHGFIDVDSARHL